MAHISLIGPGAMGGAVAAHLMASGRHEVNLCARRAFSDLIVATPDGVLSSRPVIETSPADASPADWVLVTTKTYSAAGAAEWLPALTAGGAPVAVLQNGIEHRERFAAFLDTSRLLPVIIDLPAERTEPGRIRQRGPGMMVVEEGDLGRRFAELFTGTALTVTLTDDFRSAAWRKLCLNSAGVLNALLLQPVRVFHDDAVAETARSIIRECMAVGRAEGAVLDDDLPDRIIAGQRAASPDGVNSLQADRAAGRPMELDARNGVIVRLGRKHGIPTPCNQMAVSLLTAMTAS